MSGDAMTTYHNLYTTQNESQWRAALPASRSVFGSIEFARLNEKYRGVTARLLALGNASELIAYPFVVRPLDGLPFSHPSALWDSATPEYSGPLGIRSDTAGHFSVTTHHLFKELGVIAEFMHLHPWEIEARLLRDGESSLNRDVVWVDLSRSDDDLWCNSFTPTCRNKIRRSQAENVRVLEASGLADIHEFVRIYHQTMDRNQALESYYFTEEYFAAIFESMPASARFVLAEHRGTVVAAALYLHDRDTAYSYLTGTDYAHQQVRPTNAIIYETIKWARSKGKKRLLLGAGYRQDDGVFKFKASFSNLRAPFHVYRRIHLADQYQQLEEKWCLHYSSTAEHATYFPSYRSVAPMKMEDESVCDAN